MAELKVVGLIKSYGATAVVDDIGFTVPSGQFFALLGPSGSGKTTILRMISGFVQPDAGHVYVDGDDVTFTPPERRRMGVVFQSYALFPHMTVWHNVAFGLTVRHVPAAEQGDRIREVLRLTHLTGLEDRRPGQLSGGQQQRVALARALVIEPRLLLLDEPLSALDTRIRLEMRSELRRIQHESGVTAVIVTHDQEEAMELADDLLVLDTGRVAQSGRPREVYTHPRSGHVGVFMGRGNHLQAILRKVPGGLLAVLGEDGPSLPVDPGTVASDLIPIGPEGSEIHMFFRPERVHVQRVTDPPAGGGTRDEPGLLLEGRVGAVRFDGPVSRLEIGNGSWALESLLLSRDAEGFTPGEAVRIFVPARDIRIFA